MNSSGEQSAAHDRVRAIQARLQELGRPGVRIIGVSKTHGPERIVELFQAGIRDFGENRQNEARDKFPVVARTLADALAVNQPGRDRPRYHHIGALQSGSARQIPGLFDTVHGVSAVGADSALATLIKSADRKLTAAEQTLTYLIQVALTGETSKVGGMPIDAVRNLGKFPESETVRFGGFMTMGPESQDPDQTREVFHQLRELRDEIAPHMELSMGMSGDWELAVTEGATMIRVGTALFGTRGPGPWAPPS